MKQMKAGRASSKSNRVISMSGRIMNRPTSTKTGAVATAGTKERRGERNMKGRKKRQKKDPSIIR
ncbi:MAG: hypothetical protein H8E10_16280 [Desulfobacterales bacterium]|nr:hypothetical protein [Desulfobacterales bacterium]MBL7173564.1 hypothetical protein [Desulfobacteraceae bacterium]